MTHFLHLNGHRTGHVYPLPSYFHYRDPQIEHCLGYLPSSIWFYHIGTHVFPTCRVACHYDHVLIYPRAAAEWRPYGSHYPLPSYFHYRDPQIETLSWVLPIFNIVLSHWDPLLSNPRVACHCDHVLIYPRAATEWHRTGHVAPYPLIFHFRDTQIETLPRLPPVFSMALSHWDPLLSQPSGSLSL